MKKIILTVLCLSIFTPTTFAMFPKYDDSDIIQQAQAEEALSKKQVQTPQPIYQQYQPVYNPQQATTQQNEPLQQTEKTLRQINSIKNGVQSLIKSY